MAKANGRAPVDRVERWPLSRIVPYIKNPRMHSDDQIDQIAASMKMFGQAQLIVVDPEGEIIVGHGRVLAAQKLGWADMVVGIASGWSEEQKRAYRIADNQIGLTSKWDEELLRAEVMSLGDFDLSTLAFTNAELNKLLTNVPDEAEIAPELPKKPFVRRGDLWALGEHRLLCGDATSETDVAKCLTGMQPVIMVTDPPYGVDYDASWRSRLGVNLNPKKLGKVTNDNRSDWSEAWSLFPGDIAYVWHAGLHSGTVEASLIKNKFTLVSQIIWVKDRLVLSRGDYHWQHEPCWYGVRAGKNHNWTGDRSQTTTWQIASRDDGGHGHSTQKPVECMKRPIENNTVRGDYVYEPFCGSGTTIVACHISGRRCLAIEIDPGYVQVAIERWQTFTGNKATLDGKAYDVVRRARTKKAAKKAARSVKREVEDQPAR